MPFRMHPVQHDPELQTPPRHATPLVDRLQLGSLAIVVCVVPHVPVVPQKPSVRTRSPVVSHGSEYRHWLSEEKVQSRHWLPPLPHCVTRFPATHWFWLLRHCAPAQHAPARQMPPMHVSPSITAPVSVHMLGFMQLTWPIRHCAGGMHVCPHGTQFPLPLHVIVPAHPVVGPGSLLPVG